MGELSPALFLLVLGFVCFSFLLNDAGLVARISKVSPKRMHSMEVNGKGNQGVTG